MDERWKPVAWTPLGNPYVWEREVAEWREAERRGREIAKEWARKTALNRKFENMTAKTKAKKWRQDGSIYCGTKRTAMLVNGKDGEYPTLFIEARCASKADVRWFEQAVEKIFELLNA